MIATSTQASVPVDEERSRVLARERQRRRRAGRQRIDYYPSPEAMATINALLSPVDCSANEIIDLIISDWAAHITEADGSPDPST